MITLEITGPKGERQRRHFRSFPLLVGRRQGQLRLKDPDVSAVHGQFTLEEDRLCYRDLGSTNGSFSGDGLRVRKSTQLYRGDSIHLGNHRISLVEFAAPPKNRPKAARSTMVYRYNPAQLVPQEEDTNHRAQRPTAPEAEPMRTREATADQQPPESAPNDEQKALHALDQSIPDQDHRILLGRPIAADPKSLLTGAQAPDWSQAFSLAEQNSSPLDLIQHMPALARAQAALDNAAMRNASTQSLGQSESQERKPGHRDYRKQNGAPSPLTRNAEATSIIDTAGWAQTNKVAPSDVVDTPHGVALRHRPATSLVQPPQKAPPHLNHLNHEQAPAPAQHHTQPALKPPSLPPQPLAVAALPAQLPPTPSASAPPTPASRPRTTASFAAASFQSSTEDNELEVPGQTPAQPAGDEETAPNSTDAPGSSSTGGQQGDDGGQNGHDGPTPADPPPVSTDFDPLPQNLWRDAWLLLSTDFQSWLLSGPAIVALAMALTLLLAWIPVVGPWLCILGIALLFLAFFPAMVAASLAYEQSQRGNKPRWRDNWKWALALPKHARRDFWKAQGLALLGFPLFIVPGVVLSHYVFVAVAFERREALDSVQRSIDLCNRSPAVVLSTTAMAAFALIPSVIASALLFWSATLLISFFPRALAILCGVIILGTAGAAVALIWPVVMLRSYRGLRSQEDEAEGEKEGEAASTEQADAPSSEDGEQDDEQDEEQTQPVEVAPGRTPEAAPEVAPEVAADLLDYGRPFAPQVERTQAPSPQSPAPNEP